MRPTGAGLSAAGTTGMGRVKRGRGRARVIGLSPVGGYIWWHDMPNPDLFTKPSQLRLVPAISPPVCSINSHIGSSATRSGFPQTHWSRKGSSRGEQGAKWGREGVGRGGFILDPHWIQPILPFGSLPFPFLSLGLHHLQSWHRSEIHCGMESLQWVKVFKSPFFS